MSKINFRNQKVGSYLIEGLLIVVSILVAFALDTAWSEYQENQVEREVVGELYDELVESEERIQRSIDEIELAILSGQQLLTLIGNEPPQIPVVSLIVYSTIY